MPNGGDIHSDDQREAELAKIAEKRSEATPNQTPTHKDSIGGISADLMLGTSSVKGGTVNKGIPANFSSNKKINFADLKTPVKLPTEEATAFSKAQNTFKVVNERKFLTQEVKYDLQQYQKVDLSNVDYVLVSKLDNILALPFITEKFNFTGEVVMTLPMRQIGTMILKEFVKINNQRKEKGNMVKGFGYGMGDGEFRNEKNEQFKALTSSFPAFIFDHKNDFEDFEVLEELENDGIFLHQWFECYKEFDLDELLGKVITVNYGQHLDLRGGLMVVARASGYHIGASTFKLQYGTENLLVVDGFSNHKYRHCLPLNTEDFREFNKIFITDSLNTKEINLSKSETENKLTTSEVIINRFISDVKKVLKNYPEDNIIFPMRNSLFLLDLIDIFHYKLPSLHKIHVISSTYLPTINYANANVDYLNDQRQRKIFAKTPSLPINIQNLMKEGKIEFFADMFQFVEKIKYKKDYLNYMGPSFYIIVDSTLRLGYSAKFLEIMNSEVPSATIMFTDPYLATSDVFFPLYASNRLRIVTSQLNMSDSPDELIEILAQQNPRAQVIAPKRYEPNFLKSPLKNRTLFLKDNSSLKFPLDSKEGLYIKPQIYNNLEWSSLQKLLKRKILGGDVNVGVMESGIRNDRGKLRLEVKKRKKEEKPAVLVVKKGEVLNEKTILDKMYSLAQKLTEKDFQILNVERKMDQEYVLKLMGGKSLGVNIIKHSPLETQIFTETDEEYSTILECVKEVLGVYML